MNRGGFGVDVPGGPALSGCSAERERGEGGRNQEKGEGEVDR